MAEYLYFYVGMYIITYFRTLISILFWCLAYIRDGTIALRMYVAVVSSYSWDRDATGWYQSLGSHTFSATSQQINVGLICNWVTQVIVIHSNHKYKVIYSFLEIHPWVSEISCSSLFLSPFQPTQIWIDGGHVTVLALPVTVLTGRTTWWWYFRGWRIACSSKQSSCDMDC